jgi:Bacteriocin-protection, YdeI or OmpD-Associated/Domain of unknown function (DUF1905)
MGERIRFTTVIRPTEGGTYVDVPPEVAAALGANGRTSVVGTVDGQLFRNQMMPYTFEGEGRKVVMPLNRAVRTALGKVVGETVEFELERDERSRSADVPVPPELTEALATDDAARAAFDALAPSRRREHSDHVASAKTEETRRRRAARIVDVLRRS